jgi:hypothetical protein
MDTYHVMAAAGDLAEDLRSLGLFEAGSAREALECCLTQLEKPIVESVGVPPELREDLAELLDQERRQLCEQLREPDVSFIVVATASEVHLVRDRDGQVEDVREIDRKRGMMQRDFGVDVL